MPFGLCDEEIALIHKVFVAFPDIAEVVIFGSRAMDNYKKGSDVDLALKGTLDDRTVVRVSAQLNEELPLPYLFDVIDYHTITNADLRDHIDRYGQKLYP